MRNIKVLLTSLILLWSLVFATGASAEQPAIIGEAAILMDARTGQVLYQKNANQQMYPASTTKMLTALIALEQGKLNDLVTVSKEASVTDGSAIWLKEGEQLTLEDLLYALMLNSANDAAVAISQHMAGSVDDFNKMMNKKAKEWGAKNSHFTNPHGLPDEQHYTTAYDLAMVARQAVKNKKFIEISSTKTKTIAREDQEDCKYLKNHNRLLWNYDGTVGIKTGYTSVAQQCIVAAAQREDRVLIVVVLKTQGQNIWQDATMLLDYGFNNYRLHKLLDKGEVVGETTVKHSKETIPLINGADIYYNFSVNHQPQIEKKLTLNDNAAPISKGDVLGQLALYDGEKKLKTINVLANADVKRPLITHWWFWCGVVFAGILPLVIFFKGIPRSKRNSNVRIVRRRNNKYKS